MNKCKEFKYKRILLSLNSNKSKLVNKTLLIKQIKKYQMKLTSNFNKYNNR